MNATWARFCASCGNPLTAPPQQIVAPQTPAPSPAPPPTVAPQGVPPPSIPPPWYSYTPPIDFAFKRRTEIDRTKTGLLLLIIGVLLNPVPIIGVVGSLLSLIGAILVILGRDAFGSDHSRNVIWAIIIYIVGGVIVIIGGVIYAFELVTAVRLANGDVSVFSAALTTAFQDLLVLALIGGVVIGIAQVLFTYAIQNRNGRMLLWIAYAASIAVGILTSAIVVQSLSTAVQQSLVGGVYDPTPLQNLRNQLQLFGLIGFIPAALWSGALYLVWSRISRGELPPSTTPTTPMAPAYPPRP